MARLTAEAIVAAATAIVERDGADALTARRLGEQIDADPTAVYRHFADFDELRRAVGDRLLRGVLRGVPLPTAGNWQHVVERTCVRLRRANLRNPALAALVRSGPSLQPYEAAITERLLCSFAEAGFSVAAAANAYHAVIELTIGSAAIDTAVDALSPQHRTDLYRQWRLHYAEAAGSPHSRRAAAHLYRGTAEQRFAAALLALLRGLPAAG
jgi:TetR/AcrR family transcriptional regulator, tetracycline repressor protein